MHIESPQIEWRDGQPFSTQFGDIYASTRDALAETDFVFLEASGFKDAVPQQTTLSVAETGFGTGLNFLSSWAYWKQHQQGDGNLHFLSIERFPLSKEDLSRALQAWPEFKGLAEELIAVYPIRRAGFHRLVLDQGRVQLTLAFGDIQECLPEIDHQFDFWFLDGFSPSKNQDMWTEQVCKNIVRCSKVGTGLSTFTAAGAVRRALSASGFDVVKCQGFSGKREMLRATLSSPVPPTKKLPFYAIPNSETLPESVAIIGAGLAGCSMAYVCSKRGMRVSIFDPNGCAQAASGKSGRCCGSCLKCQH